MTEKRQEPGGDHPQEAFEIMERVDEEQILAELQGRVADSYVYAPKRRDGTPMKNERGEPVIGLSFSGTNWACREYARQGEAIRIVSKPEIQRDPVDPDYIIVSVVAQRFSVHPETGRESGLDSAVGVKRQWTKMERNVWDNGKIVGKEVVPDPFYVEKACSKSQRNAKQALLPTDFVKRIISTALKTAKAAPSKPAAQQPAAGSPGPVAVPGGPEGRPVAPGPQGAAKAAASGAPGGAPQDLGPMRQRLWVVLKGATGARDDDAARQRLLALTGVERVSDLSRDAMVRLGPALKLVTQGAAELRDLQDGRCFVLDKGSFKVLWPESGVLPEEPGGPEGPPAPQASQEEVLF